MTVRHILQQKGRNFWTIDPNTTVFDALAKMAEKDVGIPSVSKRPRPTWRLLDAPRLMGHRIMMRFTKFMPVTKSPSYTFATIALHRRW